MRAAALRLARADLLGPPRADRAHRVRDLRRRDRAGRHAGAARRARRAVRGRDGADRGAHVAVYGELTDADVDTLASLPGAAAAESRPRANVQAPLAGASVDVGLEGMPAEIDRPHVTEGRLPQPPPRCWSERSFAREEGLRVGDRLTLNDTAYTIAGLAVTTQQATYPRWRPGIVWAPDVTVEPTPRRRPARRPGGHRGLRRGCPTGARRPPARGHRLA